MPLPNTDEQRARISALQGELTSRGIDLPPGMVTCGCPDATLLRFLKARKMDVLKSADMIQASVDWRQRMSADEALNTFLDEDTEASLRQCIPAGHIGFTKEGHPLRLEYTTKINVVDMMRRGVSVDDYIFYHMREMEYLMHVQFPEAARMYGKEVIDCQSVVLDLSGVSIRMLNSTFFNVFSQISKMYQDNYPETMSSMFLVNIPSFFHGIWRLISGTLDDRIRQKIFFLRSRDLDVMKDFVDEKYIPIALGGKNPGEDGRYVNDSDGYIQPVHRAMQREISVRQIAAQSEGTEEGVSTDAESPFLTDICTKPSDPLQRASTSGSSASELGRIDVAYTGLDDHLPMAECALVADSSIGASALPQPQQRVVKNKRWAPRRWFKKEPSPRVSMPQVTPGVNQPAVSENGSRRGKNLGRLLCMSRAPTVTGGEMTHYAERHGEFYQLGPKAQSCRNMGIGEPGNFPSLPGSQNSIANTVGGQTIGGSHHSTVMCSSSRELISSPGVPLDNGSPRPSRMNVDSSSPVASEVGSSATPPAEEHQRPPSLLPKTVTAIGSPGCSKEIRLSARQLSPRSFAGALTPSALVLAAIAILISLVAVSMSSGESVSSRLSVVAAATSV